MTANSKSPNWRGRLRCSTEGTGRETGRGQDESGAVLILALVYLIVVSLIVGGLTDWAMNDLNNTSNFTSARSLQTAASSVTETAIQSIRYTPLLSTTQTLNASPPGACWGTGTSSGLTTANGNAVDGASMDVWCSTAWNPTSASTRVVTFSTCPSSMTATNCALTPLLQAKVTYDDYPPGINAPSTGQCAVFCGTGMTVNSWIWSPVVPVVNTIVPSPAPTITGGTTLTINGSYFVPNASTVNFVLESGGAALGAQPFTVTPTNVTASQITLTTPTVIAGLAYYVTVTTPGGTSASASNILTYSAVKPVVSSLSPILSSALFTPPNPATAGGSTSGGTPVTINGTGFVTGATVLFVPVVPGGTSYPATGVSVPVIVAGNTETLTAFSPLVPAAAQYYVEVTTPGPLTSATSTSDIFTYFAPVPNPSGS